MNEEGSHTGGTQPICKRSNRGVIKAGIRIERIDKMLYEHGSDSEGTKDIQVGTVSHRDSKETVHNDG
jgi:hypothetical protein